MLPFPNNHSSPPLYSPEGALDQAKVSKLSCLLLPPTGGELCLVVVFGTMVLVVVQIGCGVFGWSYSGVCLFHVSFAMFCTMFCGGCTVTWFHAGRNRWCPRVSPTPERLLKVTHMTALWGCDDAARGTVVGGAVLFFWELVTWKSNCSEVISH